MCVCFPPPRPRIPGQYWWKWIISLPVRCGSGSLAGIKSSCSFTKCALCPDLPLLLPEQILSRSLDLCRHQNFTPGGLNEDAMRQFGILYISIVAAAQISILSDVIKPKQKSNLASAWKVIIIHLSTFCFYFELQTRPCVIGKWWLLPKQPAPSIPLWAGQFYHLQPVRCAHIKPWSQFQPDDDLRITQCMASTTASALLWPKTILCPWHRQI